MRDTDLFNDAVEEVVEESFAAGGSLYGGTGASGTYSRKSNPREWGGGSPANRGMTGGEEGYNIKDIAAESEEFAKEAGKNQLYPLNNINEFLVSAYLELGNAESQLHSCVKYNKVLTKDEEKKALLQHSYDKVAAIRDMIRSVSADIDRVTLSAS